MIFAFSARLFDRVSQCSRVVDDARVSGHDGDELRRLAEQLCCRYVGDYELFPAGNVFISRQADDLMMRQVGAVAGPPMPQPIRLIAASETTFMGPDARIVFPPVTDGRAPQISFTVPRLKTERMGRRIE